MENQLEENLKKIEEDRKLKKLKVSKAKLRSRTYQKSNIAKTETYNTKNKISMGQKNAWAKIPHIQPKEQPFGYIDTTENNKTNTNDLWQ